MQNNKFQNYNLISRIETDNSIVEIYEQKEKDLKVVRQNLTNLYDVIFDMARSAEEKGIDVSNWFYTEEQVQEMKKNPKYKFI